MSKLKVKLPKELNSTAMKTQEIVYNKEVKEYVKCKINPESNIGSLYAVAWGQCSKAKKAKVKATAGHKEKLKKMTFLVLQYIRTITQQFNERRNKFLSVLDARTTQLTCRQELGQPNDVY
jgi:hypothetical protein